MKLQKETIIFILIVLLGLVLRLLFIDNPTGLWYDEMAMYNQAVSKFPFGIIKAAMIDDIHMPVYQILLAIWMKIFSSSDVVIRLFSVLIGTLNIVIAYFIGKELKDKKLGNTFAFFIAINSVLIYYSQEIKFYSMLAMLATLALYFWLRIKNRNDILSYVGYVVVNVLIIYTYTIAGIYVFAEFLAFLLYILVRDRNLLKRFLVSNIVLLLCILPLFIFVLMTLDNFKHPPFTSCNFSTMFVILQNYFSPVFIFPYSNPESYTPQLYMTPMFYHIRNQSMEMFAITTLLSFLIVPIFIFIPVFIYVSFICRSIKEDKDNIFIMLVFLFFILGEVILVLNSGFRIITRYTILMLPPLLFLASVGMRSLKSITKKTIIVYILVTTFLFIVFSPISAVRGYRNMGQKPVGVVLTDNKINDNDTLIVGIRKTEFSKYINFHGRIFQQMRLVYRKCAYDKTKKDRYEGLRAYIFDTAPYYKKYEKVFLKKVINPMKKGDRIFLIWDRDYTLFPQENPAEYRRLPINTMAISKADSDAYKICTKYLKKEKDVKLEYYRVIIFRK